MIEPPVPPGLGQLSAPLRAFVEFFGIDQDLVGAAATASPALKATTEPIERWVPLLPELERNSLLVRAARGEPIGAELLRRLREVGGAQPPAASGATRRTFSAIMAAVEVVRQERKAREQREAERARLAKLDTLAKHEEQVWAAVPALLARRIASGYDEAGGAPGRSARSGGSPQTGAPPLMTGSAKCWRPTLLRQRFCGGCASRSW